MLERQNLCVDMSEMKPERRIRRRGLAAHWFGRGVPAGFTLAGAAVLKHHYFLIPFALAFVAFSAWHTMNRLYDGPSWRSLGWVAVNSLLMGSAIALCFVFRSREAMYVILGLAVLTAPQLATQITGERPADP
jgi:hypothetical protein